MLTPTKQIDADEQGCSTSWNTLIFFPGRTVDPDKDFLFGAPAVWADAAQWILESLPSDWKRHYNRTLKIMRPYLEGNKPKKTVKNRNDYVSGFAVPVDYTDYLHKCHNNVSQTDYFTNRGLSQKTIDKFKLGYDPEKNLVTIPYNPDCRGYVDRVLWDGNSKY